MLGFNNLIFLSILFVSICNGAPSMEFVDLNKRNPFLSTSLQKVSISHQKRQFVNTGIRPTVIQNGAPIQNGIVPIQNGIVPIQNGIVPIQNGIVPIPNGPILTNTPIYPNINNQALQITSGAQLGGVGVGGVVPPFVNGGRVRNVAGGNGRPSGLLK